MLSFPFGTELKHTDPVGTTDKAGWLLASSAGAQSKTKQRFSERGTLEQAAGGGGSGEKSLCHESSFIVFPASRGAH